MFPEYRDQITQLMTQNPHFVRLFERHAALDQQVQRMASHNESSTSEQMERLKKEKLQLKDEIYALLKKATQA